MSIAQVVTVIRLLAALAAFGIGAVSAWRGVQIIVARELKDLEKRVADDLTTALSGPGAAVSVDELAKLLDALTKLLGAKSGPGAFLCVFGLALGAAGYFILAGI